MVTIDGRVYSNIHYKWTKNIDPVAYVKPGEVFEVYVPDSSIGQIKENFTDRDLEKINKDKLDGAVGPIYIEGTEPGDTLKVEIMDIEVENWGWSALFKDFGLLKGEFNDKLVIWKIENGYASTKSDILNGIRIPTSPFLGVMGTASESEEFGMIPPQYFGGNMDNKLLTSKNSIIYLPVFVKGAYLSLGDPHASQGDGEVCGTAIETSANVKLRVNIEKDRDFIHGETKLESPREVIIATGINENLYDASKIAVKNMIRILEKYNFKADEAYLLCSVAGDLRISEIVDEPNFVVSCTIPKDIATQRLNL